MVPRTVLVTGCSSGFGLLTAARLASKGHRVFATMRDVTRQDRLVQEAERRGGVKNLTVLPLDVTDPTSIRNAINEVMSRAGTIDILINNAGFGVGGFFEDLSPRDWEEQFAVNFFGVLNVTRAVLPVMRPRKKGLVINISSMAAFSGTPAFSAYCSSKFALEGFSECLYMEMQQFGIRVALVEPGAYRTKIFEENARYARRFHDPDSPYYSMSRFLLKTLGNHLINNHRDPEEVAVVIEDVINSPFPAFRNIIGFRSRFRYWGLRFLPFKMYAYLVNRVLQPHA